MARNKRKYVVGWDDERAPVMGYTRDNDSNWAQPTTIRKCCQLQKSFYEKSQIYELVPVDENGKRMEEKDND